MDYMGAGGWGLVGRCHPDRYLSAMTSGGSWADSTVKNPSKNRTKILLITLCMMYLLYFFITVFLAIYRKITIILI